MLLSPATCQEQLEALLSPTSAHTALLATPQGRIVSRASVRGEIIQELDGEPEEPWLEEPERMRLLLGLLSQWTEDESPRIECELGRLLLRTIPLPPVDPPAHAPSLPSVRSTPINRLVLLVNGTTGTPWSDLVAKSEAFKL